MRVCVLSSGSKGNCSYIETKHHKILIDIGNSSAYVERSLRSIGVDFDNIGQVRVNVNFPNAAYSPSKLGES